MPLKHQEYPSDAATTPLYEYLVRKTCFLFSFVWSEAHVVVQVRLVDVALNAVVETVVVVVDVQVREVLAQTTGLVGDAVRLRFVIPKVWSFEDRKKEQETQRYKQTRPRQKWGQV